MRWRVKFILTLMLTRFNCNRVDHNLDLNMMKETMTDTQTDWRYSDERMDVRTQGLNILLKKFGSEICSDGSPRYSNQSIYECIHDWVSQGNMRTDGIVAYYKAYYDPSKRSN